MPWKCSLGSVLIDRITESLSMIDAQRGINWLIWSPGIEVGIAANGPPLIVPGFGSQVSN